MTVNMDNFSQFKSYDYYLNKSNNIPANYQQKAPKLKKDSFTFMGKELNKKKTATALIGVSALIATATIALIKRKDIYQFIKNFKLKNKPITSYEDLIPEKIIIPDGGYDLSKEADVLKYTTITAQGGFNFHIIGNKKSKVYKDLKYIASNGVGDIGITPNGRAFVKSFMSRDGGYEPRLSFIELISPNSEFTPAQKNLIALMQQGKMQSTNSPLGKKAQKYSVEDIYDLIHKWAQDIDPDNIETQKVLSQVATYKKGESNFIQDVVAQKIERAHFFR